MSINSSRLPLRAKLGYGAAELGITAVEILLQVYLLKFYNVVVGLDEIYTGLALAIAIVWDAVSDPLMGALSDRTRSRFGRRRVYLIPGAFALAFAFFLIYNPPAVDSQLYKFLYLLFTYLMVNTAMTVLGVPHMALGGDMTYDRDERTEVYGARLLFGTFGLLLGTVLPIIILSGLGEENPQNVERSRNLASLYLAIPIVATALLSFWSTAGYERQRDYSDDEKLDPASFFRSLGSVIVNPYFFPLFIAFLIASVGRALNAAIALYYYEYRLDLPESEVGLKVLLPFFGFIILSIPLWVWISKFYGKKWPAFVGVFGLGLMTCVTYPFFPAGDTTGPLIAAFIGGILGGALILLDSLVADMVDYDELKTGENREGLYFGAWRMGTKLARAVGILVTAMALGVIDFDQDSIQQSAEAIFGLGVLFGPIVGGFFIVGALVFTLMPLTDARHKRIQSLLQRKRDAKQG
ncbi:MAG: MFS transporter [bacterium]|nr:MFS transporter [bacterium]